MLLVESQSIRSVAFTMVLANVIVDTAISNRAFVLIHISAVLTTMDGQAFLVFDLVYFLIWSVCCSVCPSL